MRDMVKLTDNQVLVLGKPNFACGKMAKILIATGLYEDKEKSAEYEQAVWIHWASALLETHGDNWKEVAEQILNECANRINSGT